MKKSPFLSSLFLAIEKKGWSGVYKGVKRTLFYDSGIVHYKSTSSRLPLDDLVLSIMLHYVNEKIVKMPAKGAREGRENGCFPYFTYQEKSCLSWEAPFRSARFFMIKEWLSRLLQS